jgi:hypothetical protein
VGVGDVDEQEQGAAVRVERAEGGVDLLQQPLAGPGPEAAGDPVTGFNTGLPETPAVWKPRARSASARVSASAGSGRTIICRSSAPPAATKCPPCAHGGRPVKYDAWLGKVQSAGAIARHESCAPPATRASSVGLVGRP